MPAPLLDRVRRAIRDRALLGDGDRVLAAVSGGPDSVALCWVLSELESHGGWTLAGLVHVHHGLRPGEADEDEAFCRQLAARLGRPIHVVRADVRARARARRVSIESAARLERYAAFEDALEAMGANRIATGHTLDDQAETVLLRLLRGAGARGISAIRARRGAVIRPLLEVARNDLQRYLDARGETFRLDSSNLDIAIPRNRLRHTVMPLITADWPGATRALARFAELAVDDEACLTGMAGEMLATVGAFRGGGVQLDVRSLVAMPAALARRVVRQAIESAGSHPGFADIERVRRLAAARTGPGHLDLAGAVIDRDGPVLRISAPAGAGSATRPFYWPLAVPGIAEIPETRGCISASLTEGREFPTDVPQETAVLQADRLALPLAVRSRRPGDRLRPFGAPGSRKLQDLLVDRKIPRGERDRVPIVVDARGRIVWVAGVAIAHECRVTTPESGMVILKLKKDLQ